MGNSIKMMPNKTDTNIAKSHISLIKDGITKIPNNAITMFIVKIILNFSFIFPTYFPKETNSISPIEILP